MKSLQLNLWLCASVMMIIQGGHVEFKTALNSRRIQTLKTVSWIVLSLSCSLPMRQNQLEKYLNFQDSEASNMYDWINVTFHITLSLLYKLLTKTSFFSKFIFLSYYESYAINYIVFFTIKWRVEEDVCDDDVEYWYRSNIIFYMHHLILFFMQRFL